MQAQTCHTGKCPTGVATQDSVRQLAINVPDKAERVSQFHRSTLIALGELVGAAGLTHPAQLRPLHIQRRVSAQEVRTFAEVYEFLQPGDLLRGAASARYQQQWSQADSGSFGAVEPDSQRARATGPLPSIAVAGA